MQDEIHPRTKTVDVPSSKPHSPPLQHFVPAQRGPRHNPASTIRPGGRQHETTRFSSLSATALTAPGTLAARPDVSSVKSRPSLIRTHGGQTIVLTHDTNTARPYSRDFAIQGSKGIVEKYPEARVYLDGKSPEHEWEELIANYADQFEHPLWRALEQRAEGSGHDGMDFVQTYRLVYCLRNGLPLDLDLDVYVYDGTALCAVSELSERSIAQRSKTMDFLPDFTRGEWINRPPVGIVTA